MIKAVFWDIGGVLLTDPLLDNFWKNKQGATLLRTAFGEGKIDQNEFISKGSILLGLSPENFINNYEKIYCTVTKLSKTADLVNKIKIPQYVLSDTNPIHGNYILKTFPDLFSKFNKVFLSYEIGMRKKSKEVFNFISKEIKIPQKEILFIDNNQKIIEIAKSAGFQTFLFGNSSSLKTYLEEKELLK